MKDFHSYIKFVEFRELRLLMIDIDPVQKGVTFLGILSEKIFKSP